MVFNTGTLLIIFYIAPKPLVSFIERTLVETLLEFFLFFQPVYL